MSFSMDWWWNIYQNFLLDEHFSKQRQRHQTTRIYRNYGDGELEMDLQHAEKEANEHT